MNNFFFIFLSAFLSLTLISCSRKDDSSSSSSSTSTSQTFVDSNFCNFKKNTSSRNSSLIVNEKKSRKACQKLKGHDHSKKTTNIKIFSILTTSILDNWMKKVGRTSKSDVKQREKKP